MKLWLSNLWSVAQDGAHVKHVIYDIKLFRVKTAQGSSREANMVFVTLVQNTVIIFATYGSKEPQQRPTNYQIIGYFSIELYLDLNAE